MKKGKIFKVGKDSIEDNSDLKYWQKVFYALIYYGWRIVAALLIALVLLIKLRSG
jgi:hypothetical protein